MSKLKCPYCGKVLTLCEVAPLPLLYCPDEKCRGNDLLMVANCWQELIKTKNRLDITVMLLQDIDGILEDARYGDTNHFILDSADARNIADDVKEALEKSKEQV